MKFAAAANIFAVLFSSSLAAARVAETQHPVEKVIKMLNGLIAKAEFDGKQEAVTYDKFEYWGRNSVKELSAAIAEEHEVIAVQEDIIEGKTKRAETLDDQIKELKVEIAQRENSNTEADKLRGDTALLYADASSDFAATITAIKQAIAGLEDAKDAKGDAALVAVRSVVQRAMGLVAAVATEEQQGALSSFVQESPERPELKAQGDRQGHVQRFKFRSGGIIEVLKQLQQQFEAEELSATKGETNSMNAHALTIQASDAAIKSATKSDTTKTSELADVRSAIIDSKKTLQDATADLKADTDTLKATKTSIAIKKTEWIARSEVREKEIESMHVAIKILADVTGVRTEAPTNPVPPPSPVADDNAVFMQITDPKMRAVELLRREARATHSNALERLAQEVAAHLTGPFDEVNNMIEKMIFRLMAEQTDEDNHKNWCDLELSKSSASKINKEKEMDGLTAKIDVATSKIAKLTSEITTANDMVNEIAAHITEASEIRQVGKKENAVAVKDAQDAQTAIANAVAVLETFYKESGKIEKETWEFVQREPVALPDDPKTWSASYTGVADPAGQPHGIITMLKTVAAEFATMEADTLAQEETDKSQYEEDMSRCDIEKARRLKEGEMKLQEKKRLASKVDSMTKMRKNIDSEHEAVVQYLHDLRPACVEGDSTYDDRKAARSEETDALRQSQKILAEAFNFKGNETNPDFMQRSLRGNRA